jgi:hypothetical protein
MIRFRSTATGDVQMLDADGAQLLALIGKTDMARGVIMPEQMGEAIVRLQAATTGAARHPVAIRPDDADDGDDEMVDEPVTLAQRAFPLLDMLRRARVAGEPILWGT